MRRRGMTLIELLIAISLSTILVGVASFVFITAQKIFARVDVRLRAAQAFRVASNVLEIDGLRVEAPRAAATPCFDRTNTALPGWITLVGSPGSPEIRSDEIKMVTHGSVSTVDGSGNPQPSSDKLILVTYKLVVTTAVPKRARLIREVDLLEVQSNGSVAVNNASLPGAKPLASELATDATGFRVRFLVAGTWNDPGGGAGTGFTNFSPSALEVTVYLAEQDPQNRLSVSRSVELIAPPPN